jgi:hypothetical protein
MEKGLLSDPLPFSRIKNKSTEKFSPGLVMYAKSNFQVWLQIATA